MTEGSHMMHDRKVMDQKLTDSVSKIYIFMLAQALPQLTTISVLCLAKINSLHQNQTEELVDKQ